MVSQKGFLHNITWGGSRGSGQGEQRAHESERAVCQERMLREREERMECIGAMYHIRQFQEFGESPTYVEGGEGMMERA